MNTNTQACMGGAAMRSHSKFALRFCQSAPTWRSPTWRDEHCRQPGVTNTWCEKHCRARVSEMPISRMRLKPNLEPGSWKPDQILGLEG